MPELMNTREVARYLGVNEKKVYFLAKSGKIPCTRVTGKWTFPKKLIDQWIEESASGLVATKSQSRRTQYFCWPRAAMIQASGYCTISTKRKPNPRPFS